MFKKISLVALMSAMLIGTVGCSSNQDNSKESTKSEQSVKSNKPKKSSQDKDDTDDEEQNFDKSVDEAMELIKRKGTHSYEMSRNTKPGKIEGKIKFTLVDGKVTKLQEITTYDESGESDLKKQADLTELQNDVNEYKDSDLYHIELIEKGEDQYQQIFTYKVETNKMEDLFNEKMLLNGKFDLRHMIAVFMSRGFQLD